MKTVSAAMGTMIQCYGEPTEKDVVYNLDGTIAFGDRSLGGKFVMAGRNKKGRTSANSKPREEISVLTMAEVTGTRETRYQESGEEDRKLLPMKFIVGEKKGLKKARREFGTDKIKTLASTLDQVRRA
jgi:hypothetical protein